MSRIIFASIVGSLLFLCHPCLAQPATAAPQQKEKAKQADPSPEVPTPVAIQNGTAKLTPENSKVEFVGVHVADEPNPRLGGFSKFKGEMKLTDDGKSVNSVAIEFQTDSVWTLLPDLTTHLKTADFLNVGEHPTSKFQSTKIVPSDKPGIVDITGNFSLLGETKEISFPAKIKIDGSGVLLKTEFKLDRTQFGMSKMTEKVGPKVAVKVSVGEKTKGKAAGKNASQGQRRDPAKFFARMDADGDGKLTGDEIPERMKDRVKQIDTNSDGSISLDEMTEMLNRRRGGGQ